MQATTEAEVRSWVDSWVDELEAVGERLGQHFGRAEPRRRALEYVRGLASDVERKNGWQLAEAAGDDRRYVPDPVSR